jgi:hypothetical protein
MNTRIWLSLNSDFFIGCQFLTIGSTFDRDIFGLLFKIKDNSKLELMRGIGWQ